MAHFTGNIENNQIILDCVVTDSELPDLSVDTARMPIFRAVLDTGAQMSCITQDAVDKIGLSDAGDDELGKVIGIGGTMECPLHVVNLHVLIPQVSAPHLIGQSFPYVVVYQVDNIGCDLLIGMDIISHFHFTIHSRNRFTLGL